MTLHGVIRDVSLYVIVPVFFVLFVANMYGLGREIALKAMNVNNSGRSNGLDSPLGDDGSRG